MKGTVKINNRLYFRGVSYFALGLVLSFLIANYCVKNAAGQTSSAESNISLNVKNKPLGEVLMKISQDTGYKFKLSAQWSSYPISAVLEDMPLNQVLKRILDRLNHAIIYESDKSINIVIYGKADLRKINPTPAQSFSPPTQNYQETPLSSPESSSGKEGHSENLNESSRETDASGGAEEKNIENNDATENLKEKDAEKAIDQESKESDKDL